MRGLVEILDTILAGFLIGMVLQTVMEFYIPEKTGNEVYPYYTLLDSLRDYISFELENGNLTDLEKLLEKFGIKLVGVEVYLPISVEVNQTGACVCSFIYNFTNLNPEASYVVGKKTNYTCNWIEKIVYINSTPGCFDTGISIPSDSRNIFVFYNDIPLKYSYNRTLIICSKVPINGNVHILYPYSMEDVGGNYLDNVTLNATAEISVVDEKLSNFCTVRFLANYTSLKENFLFRVGTGQISLVSHENLGFRNCTCNVTVPSFKINNINLEFREGYPLSIVVPFNFGYSVLHFIARSS